jgi:hypothetical protein
VAEGQVPIARCQAWNFTRDVEFKNCHLQFPLKIRAVFAGNIIEFCKNNQKIAKPAVFVIQEETF